MVKILEVETGTVINRG